MSNLNPCPCGKIPDELHIHPGDTSKWAWVSGSCCDEWNIEFRTKYLSFDSQECILLATEAWNAAPRAAHTNNTTEEHND